MVATLVAETFREDFGADPTLLRTEADHRIANNLALIAGLTRLIARALPATGSMEMSEVRFLLKEVGLRIDAIGQLHHALAGATTTDSVELAGFLGRIANTVMSGFADENRASLMLELTPMRVPNRQASAVGLIVQEAITNALKYSHPSGVRGEISVACRRNAQHAVVIEVADDGVGFPEDFDPSKSTSLGMKLQRSLAQQIDAELDFVSGPTGLCMRVTLPGQFPVLLEPVR